MIMSGDRVTTKNPDLISDCNSRIGTVVTRMGDDYKVSFHCSTEVDETKMLLLKEHQLLLVDDIIDWYFEHREDVESKYYVNDSVVIDNDYLDAYSVDFSVYNRIGIVVDTYEGKCCVRFFDGKADTSECWEIDENHLIGVNDLVSSLLNGTKAESVPKDGDIMLLGQKTIAADREISNESKFTEGDMVLPRNAYYYDQINNLYHNTHDLEHNVPYIGHIVSIELPDYNPNVEIPPEPYVTVTFGVSDTCIDIETFTCTIPQGTLVIMPTVAFDYINWTKTYGGTANVGKIIEEMSHIDDLYDNNISHVFNVSDMVMPLNNIIYQRLHDEIDIREGNHISLTGKVIDIIPTTGVDYVIVSMNEVTDSGKIEAIYHVAVSRSDIVIMNDTGKMTPEMVKELWGSNEDAINCLIGQYWSDKDIERRRNNGES